jgi:ABC-type multidrug transport system ATPase subunit
LCFLFASPCAAQQKPLFIPGLTYTDMITYAVRLRVDQTKVTVKERVDDILTIMNLHYCKNRRISESPPTRGELGCDMKRLSIAIEIVHLPPMIVVDDPNIHFEPAIAIKIMECFQTLAKRGHIVVLSMTKPSSPEFSMLDRVVMLCNGHSIYSGPPSRIEEHFCSETMGYVRKKDVDLSDFALDICFGIERPNNLRAGELPSVMQYKYQSSPLFLAPVLSEGGGDVQAFTEKFFKFFGYAANTKSLATHALSFKHVFIRALETKFKNTQTLKGYFACAVLLSSLMGYLQYGQADYGHYALTLVGMPYQNTTNVGSLCFFMSLFTQVWAFVDVQAVCAKLQLFRYEQLSGVTNAPLFFLATLLTEAPFGILFGLVFSNIVYGMVQFKLQQDDYGFFVSCIILSALVGMSCTIMYCAIFKKELAVRDMFFFSLAIVVLLSGFPFAQPVMPDYLVDFSSIIPTRYVTWLIFSLFF